MDNILHIFFIFKMKKMNIIFVNEIKNEIMNLEIINLYKY